MKKDSIVFYIWSIFKYQFLSIKAAVDMAFYRFITLNIMRFIADITAACLMTFHCFVLLPIVVIYNFIALIGTCIYHKKIMVEYFEELKEEYRGACDTIKRDYHDFLNRLEM